MKTSEITFRNTKKEILDELKDYNTGMCDFIGDLSEDLAHELRDEFDNCTMERDIDNDHREMEFNYCIKRIKVS